MHMINEQVYQQDVHLLSSKEKDEVINRLREKVNCLEGQKDGYKNLTDDTISAYQRMKELYNVQSDKNRFLEDENQMLFNDISFLRYQLNSLRDDNQMIREDNISSLNKQFTLESPMSRKQVGGQNAGQSFQLNFQNAANNGIFNQNSNNPKADTSNPQYLKNIRTLSRQFSTNSVSSNGGSANPNMKLLEQNEESERIQMDYNMNLGGDQYKRYSNLNIPLAGPQDNEGGYENQLPKHFQDETDYKNYILSANLGDLLFQDFLIIGPSLDEIKNKVDIGKGGINAQNNQNQGKDRLSSNISSSKQSNQKSADKEESYSQAILFDLVEGKLSQSQQEFIAKHPFPFNVKCKKVKVKSQYSDFMEFFKNLFTENKVQDIKQFSFVMEREDIMEQKSANKKVSQVIEASNPNKKQYCIYFEWKEFLFSEKTEKEKQMIIYEIPLVFCFVTYYPFFTFFREILCHIISKLQLDRIPWFYINNEINSELRRLDLNYVIQQFEQNAIYKKKLSELQLHKPQIQQMIHFNLDDSNDSDMNGEEYQQNINNEQYNINNQHQSTANQQQNTQNQQKFSNSQQNDYSAKVSFMVPNYKQLKLLETSYYSGSHLILQLLTFDDFWFILSLIMLEQQVVFYSERIQYVASAMQTFSSIYKPFNKAMLILHIFENGFTFLETPTPFIGGINLSHDSIKQRRIICKDSSRVNFIDLDNLTFFLSSDTIEFIENNNAFMNYTKYFYQLRQTYNILIISDDKSISDDNKSNYNNKNIQHQKIIPPIKTISLFCFDDHNRHQLSNQTLFQKPPVPKNIIENFRAKQPLNAFGSQSQTFPNVTQTYDLKPKSSTNILNISNSKLTKETDEQKFVREYQVSKQIQFIKDIKTKALEEMQDLLELTFQHYIINNLPLDQNIDVHSKQFNDQEFLEKIVKRCEEKEFTKLFFRTQNFSYFYQQFYENLNIQKPNTSSTKATSSYPATANSVQNKN